MASRVQRGSFGIPLVEEGKQNSDSRGKGSTLHVGQDPCPPLIRNGIGLLIAVSAARSRWIDRLRPGCQHEDQQSLACQAALNTRKGSQIVGSAACLDANRSSDHTHRSTGRLRRSKKVSKSWAQKWRACGVSEVRPPEPQFRWWDHRVIRCLSTSARRCLCYRAGKPVFLVGKRRDRGRSCSFRTETPDDVVQMDRTSHTVHSPNQELLQNEEEEQNEQAV